MASGKQGTKTSAPTSRADDRLRGIVQRIYRERGFGFIREADSGQDYFFHSTGLDDCNIGQLEEGLAVVFEMRETPKGKRAEHVQRAE